MSASIEDINFILEVEQFLPESDEDRELFKRILAHGMALALERAYARCESTVTHYEKLRKLKSGTDQHRAGQIDGARDCMQGVSGLMYELRVRTR